MAEMAHLTSGGAGAFGKNDERPAAVEQFFTIVQRCSTATALHWENIHGQRHVPRLAFEALAALDKPAIRRPTVCYPQTEALRQSPEQYESVHVARMITDENDRSLELLKMFTALDC